VDLYAGYQTELYVPPAIENGRVPRNMFGNIDIYTRNMIPPGAVHVRSQQGREAARILGIDYVDAITGFDFKGRQGTAVRDGVVIAAEFKDAMVAVLEGLHYAQQQELEDWRLQRAISMWKRFVTGMKIIARVNQYKDEAEDGEDEPTRDEDSPVDDAMMEDTEIGHKLETKNFHYEIIEPPDLAAARNHLSSLTHVDSGHDIPMDDDLESLFDDSPHNTSVSKGEDDDGVAADSQPGLVSPDLGLSNEAHEVQAEHGMTERAEGEAELDTEMSAHGNSSGDGDTTSMLSHDPEDDDADPDWLD
jgi:xeroderma pigmentosum group C-complementing protein